MAPSEALTKEEFISQFKLDYALLIKDETIMSSYDSYCESVAFLRSKSIQRLRSLGIRAPVREIYNNAIQGLAETTHRKYLFHLDPRCGICGYIIANIREATIDHIYPRAHGGANALENKQLAHEKCNVMKSDKIPEEFL